jgi:flagellar FliJ protein
MAEGFALQPLLDLAQRRLEAATAALQRLAGSRQQADDDLAQLKRRHARYSTDLQQALARGIEPHRLRDYRAFLDRLLRAVDVQAEELERRRRAWADAHARWLDLRRREQALSVLRQRHRSAEAVGEGRREQRRQDELATRKASQEALEDAPATGIPSTERRSALDLPLGST